MQQKMFMLRVEQTSKGKMEEAVSNMTSLGIGSERTGKDAGSRTRRSLLKAVGVGAAGYLLASSDVKAASVLSSSPRNCIFEVTFYGATGDGKTIDSDSINRAIMAAAQKGGTVYFPAGIYLCYSIRLQSNITLELAAGAVIQAAESSTSSSVKGGFDTPEANATYEGYMDFGHSHWHNSLIWGEELKNVSIIGPGLICGKNLSRGEGRGPVAETPGVGNKAIALKNCHNVLLRDFSILSGGHFAVLATGVDNFTIDNLKVDTNRDGIDIDCCRNVRISNCSVNTPWDDAIVLKSSYTLGYIRSTEAVSIVNCYVTGGYEVGTLLDGTYKPFVKDSTIPDDDKWVRRIGRIKFGTESNGGFKNIAISNCVFESSYGIAIESVDGALIEDVTITNLTMRNIVVSPIFIRLGSRLRGPQGTFVGAIRRIIISNIVCSNSSSKYASVIAGIPGHPIEDITLSSIYVQHVGGISSEAVPVQLPEMEQEYPEAAMFGITPAQGLYARHVKGMSVSDINISSLKPDTRPLFILYDVQDVTFIQIRSRPLVDSLTFSLDNVRDFRVALAQSVPDTILEGITTRNL
ncbi:MAG: glycoside hydrolase family 28 protein [Acidobacteriaceae bacterium]|nr:glycoside hydrolase family 28 protein [Acidobacteriaceae bacterium]